MRKLQGLSVHALWASGAWLLLCLAACGGSGEDVATAAALRRAQEAAATPVTLPAIPRSASMSGRAQPSTQEGSGTGQAEPGVPHRHIQGPDAQG